MSDANAKNSNKTVQSVDRAIAILNTLAEEGTPMALTSLSAHLKLNISTVHRLLATLIVAGYVQQDLDTGKYKLGIKVFEVGNAALKYLNIPKIAKPFLKELVEKYNETVNLAVLDGQEVVYIDQVESKNVVKMMAKPGTRGPAYCTGSGKMLLTRFSDDELKRLFSKYKFIKHTKNSAGNIGELLEKIAEVKKNNYAIDREEMEEGVRCAAVGILDYEGRLAAALSLSGPANRLEYDYLEETIVPDLLSTTREITKMIGYLTL